MSAEMASPWKGCKVCVTGGAGFIGRHLTAALTEAGASVVVLDDLSTGKADPLPGGAELVKGCISDPEKRKAVLDGVGAVFHLAAIASVPKCQADPEGSKRVNRDAAMSFLQDAPGPVIFASSAAIYGVPEGVPISESHPIRPISNYGADKAAVDEAIRAGTGSHGATAMRFFNVYGHGQDPSSPYSGVLSIFADRAASDSGVTLLGDGLQTRDFIHVSDVVAALLTVGGMLLESKAKAPVAAQAYNVCTGKDITLLDVLQAMRDASGKALPAEHKPPREGDIRDSLGAPEALQAATGWSPKVLLKDGLRDIL